MSLLHILQESYILINVNFVREQMHILTVKNVRSANIYLIRNRNLISMDNNKLTKLVELCTIVFL